MATTSARLLRLLSLLTARASWPGPELADRLEVSPRTLRRDVESLRELGYPVTAGRGQGGGGYRLQAGHGLPPLLLDDEQALAIAVALQTAPLSVSGLDDALARALAGLEQVMTPPLRAEAEALHLTAVWNPWEFHGPPLPAATVKAVGHAIRHRTVFRFDRLGPDGRRPDPHDADFVAPRVVEPHHLVLWAGRWYLVAFDPAAGDWTVLRLDRLHPLAPTGVPFAPRTVPGDVGELVRSTWDRGDTVADWPCVGSVVMPLPAAVVAPWLPGGAVAEHVDAGHCRVTLGAWSWAGVAGLLATFATDLAEVEPAALREQCRALAARFARAASVEP